MKTISIFASFVFVLASCNKQESASTDTSAPAAAENETAATPYPLDVCLVSGEELGSMGDPVVIVHDGQEIKFCCDHCLPKFKADPAKYLATLEKAE